jgi:DNA mismatch repair protein MutS2
VQDIYEKFEFARVKDFLSPFLRTEVGRQKAASLTMFADGKALEEEKARLQEMLYLEARYGRLPIEVSSDLLMAVTMARKGAVLSEEELERTAHDVIVSHALVQYFSSVTEAPLLSGYMADLPHLDFLEKDIHRIIAPDMSIFDNASPKLRGLRIAIHKLEEEMKKKLGYILDQNKIYLSDTTLALKNGRYVLPVANAYKNKVKGIVQDVSSSGETTFIEPELLVEMSNKMYELRNDERSEVHRLLGILSQEVASSGDAVLLQNAMIGYLDFLEAKALYATKTSAHVAVASETPCVDLLKARHPLIDPSVVVPNDFLLSEKTSLIVISGPNAGGKTVALKTLGLLVLMNQCGLAIPAAEGSTLSYFKHIYVDIGDSQSLTDNLSTFSGHMANIGEILSSVGGRDLVLLDEVGTGTSPKEGEAIAFAVIAYLLKKHAFTLVSSHFEGLKAYALSHEEITNASMVFDEEKLVPTYKLKMGLPGESYGLVVAKRFGLPEDVLSLAKAYLSEHEETSVVEAIKKLGEVTRATELEKEATLKKEQALSEQENKLKSREAALALREEHYLSDVEEKKNELLQGYEDQMEEILHAVERNDVKLHEVIAAKKKLDDLKSQAEDERFSGPLTVGDYVNIPSAFVTGRLVSLEGKKAVVATREGLTFKTTSDKLVRTEEPPEPTKAATSGTSLDELASRKSLSLELNLIGQRAEEAELNLDKYLDECRLRGFKRVRIIHGWGSGVLRNVVRDYCDDHKDFVASYEGAQGNEGGGGATIVHLK